MPVPILKESCVVDLGDIEGSRRRNVLGTVRYMENGIFGNDIFEPIRSILVIILLPCII